MFVQGKDFILYPFLPFVMDDTDIPPAHSRWLELADIAFRLDDARKKQDEIKEAIRPTVEKYKRIREAA